MEFPRTESTAVAEILSRANLIESAEELEQLTSGVLALKARKLVPVASADETLLLLVINEGVPVALTDRVRSLLEKRDDGTLTPGENDELLELAEEVERRGVDRLAALTELAELRGVAARVDAFAGRRGRRSWLRRGSGLRSARMSANAPGAVANTVVSKNGGRGTNSRKLLIQHRALMIKNGLHPPAEKSESDSPSGGSDIL